MEIFVYKKGTDKVEEGFTREDLPALLADKTNVVWVDFLGETVPEIELASMVLLEEFKFHKLTIEDCIETRNQPKVEAFEEYLYFIVHAVMPDVTTAANFRTKELDGYLGDNYLVTFHLDRFMSIKKLKQQIRMNTFACQRGPAYLLYQILDHIVDLYMPVIDDFEDAVNKFEDQVFLMKQPDNKVLEKIMDLRRSVVRLKRISSRQMDVLQRMSHGEFPQIPEFVLPFYRDLYDHLLRISDLSESYRDLVNSLFDIHFNVTANRTNDIMKFLTIFSAIWLPLSFIAGVYGMNFENMPEIKSHYGYFLTLGAMAFVTLGMLGYFWYKGWIFRKQVEMTDEDTDIHGTRVND